MEFLQCVRKSFYKLKEDYSCESALYPEEICFIPAQTEGVVIDCHTIGLIPGIYGTDKYGEIVRRELRAKADNAFLLLIAGRIISFHISRIEHVRNEGYPIFEDDEDREQYFNEEHELTMKAYLEGKENGST